MTPRGLNHMDVKDTQSLSLRLRHAVCAFCKQRRSVAYGCSFPCPVGLHSPGALRLMDARIARIICVLHERWQTQLAISDLANLVHLGESQLSHLFKLDTGTSIGTFLQVRRLWHAAHRLAFTYESVKEICHSVGYQDVADFDRFFRERFRESPLSFRHRAQWCLVAHGAPDWEHEIAGFTKRSQELHMHSPSG